MIGLPVEVGRTQGVRVKEPIPGLREAISACLRFCVESYKLSLKPGRILPPEAGPWISVGRYIATGK